jgi:hypothetical protein
MVSHGKRVKTVEGFLSEIISPDDDFLEAIKNMDVKKQSIKIINHKKETKNKYKEELKKLSL